MSSKSGKTSRGSERVLEHKQEIPIQVTELSAFDENFSTLRQNFIAEMRRLEVEMMKFSTNLSHFYEQASHQSSKKEDAQANWDVITSSPLVQGDGETKTVKLQFDVSHFDPGEVQVKILNDVLIVSAAHEEKSDNAIVHRQYNREFMLPPGTDPGSVVSSLTKDGVLIVQAPLPPPQLEHNPSLQKQLKL